MEAVIKIGTKAAFSVAFLNPDQSISLFLNETTESTPIVLICKQNSVLKYLLVRPTNENGWRLALKEKLPIDQSQQKELNENDNNSGKPNNVVIQSPLIELNQNNPLPENIELVTYLKKKFKMISKDNSLVPSIYSLLGCYEHGAKYFVYCQAHVAAPLVIVFRTESPFGRGKFIKLTHGTLDESETMKYLQGLDDHIKRECNHIGKIYKFEQVYLKDNDDLFFAAYLMNKKHFGKEICERLRVESFDSPYTTNLFDTQTPIELTYMELLEPLNVKKILDVISTSRIVSSRLKVLISTRWIGQCLKILQQLHSTLNILHCDISFDNILTRKSVGHDEFSQIIEEECNLYGMGCDPLIPDLVISDLNTSIKLQGSQVNESRSSISHPDTIKFPYTWHTYNFYGTMQADNYAMAIVIAKLVRRLVFEDFNDFVNIDKFNTIHFKLYRESVIKYFEEKKNDENVDTIQRNFLCGLTELLIYILGQTKECPSILSTCIKIYQTKLAN